jgi:hypothetical protein
MNKHFMTLVMLTIFVVMVGIASQFSPQARFMPFVVGIPGIALCLLQLFLDFRASRHVKPNAPADMRNEYEKAQEKASGIVKQKMEFDMAREQAQVVVSDLPQGGETQREIILWACIIGLVGSIILFGFWPTIPVFLVLFLHYFAEKSWRFSLSLGAAGTAVLFLVFQKGLGVILHSGFITEQLLDYFSDM